MQILLFTLLDKGWTSSEQATKAFLAFITPIAFAPFVTQVGPLAVFAQISFRLSDEELQGASHYWRLAIAQGSLFLASSNMNAIIHSDSQFRTLYHDTDALQQHRRAYVALVAHSQNSLCDAPGCERVLVIDDNNLPAVNKRLNSRILTFSSWESRAGHDVVLGEAVPQGTSARAYFECLTNLSFVCLLSELSSALTDLSTSGWQHKCSPAAQLSAIAHARLEHATCKGQKGRD